MSTPIIKHAELVTKQRVNVYLYQFSHKGALGGKMDIPFVAGENNYYETNYYETNNIWYGITKNLKVIQPSIITMDWKLKKWNQLQTSRYTKSMKYLI